MSDMPAQNARRFREVLLNGTWVANTNLKAQLDGLDWEKAAQVPSPLRNSIAALAFHLHYYIGGVLQVLHGGPLDIRDRYSFDMPPIGGQADWETRCQRLWADAEAFAQALESMPAEQLAAPFVEARYGSYQRNIDGMIEHCYYHLGQIVLIKALL